MLRFRSITLCFLGLVGCTASVSSFTPGVRPLPLESSDVLPEGVTGVQVSGGGGAGVVTPKEVHGVLRVRHSVTETTELSVEGVAVRHHFSDGGCERSYLFECEAQHRTRFYGMGRLGVKYHLLRGIAITGGLGTGSSSWGHFLSPDLGIIFAYENDIASPFMSLYGYMSQPLGAKAVGRTDRSLDSQASLREVFPLRTGGTSIQFGLRVPVGPIDEASGMRRFALTGAFKVGYQFNRDEDSRYGDAAAHVRSGLGLETLF